MSELAELLKERVAEQRRRRAAGDWPGKFVTPQPVPPRPAVYAGELERVKPPAPPKPKPAPVKRQRSKVKRPLIAPPPLVPVPAPRYDRELDGHRYGFPAPLDELGLDNPEPARAGGVYTGMAVNSYEPPSPPCLRCGGTGVVDTEGELYWRPCWSCGARRG